MQYQQTLPCPTPNCGTQIPFDTYELLKGTQFVCPKCHVSVGLAHESRDLVRESMKKFEVMRRDLLKKKNDSSF